MSASSTTYPDWSDVLQRADALVSAAECHGLFSGVLSLHLDSTVDACLPSLFAGGPEAGVDLFDDGGITQLFDNTREDLLDPELLFTLLLPDDDELLSERVLALTEWCHGFLFGLGLAGFRPGAKLPEEVREFTQDLLAISRATEAEIQEAEDNENDYFELVEYVRIGVLYLIELLQSEPPVVLES